MKSFLPIIIFLFYLSSATAQLPGLNWAKNIGGSRGLCVRPDAAGNVYTTGYFGGVGDFDPGPGTFYLTADGGDGYVSKLDANGNFVWALLVGGNDGTNSGVAVLPDVSGNVYMVGYFSGTVDFDPGPATVNITSNGQNDICVLKLDANGNFIWAKTVGSTQSDVGYAAALDPSGNICVTGIFQGTVDFDPGPGIFTMTGGGGVFNRCFILKLDANGNYIQALQIAAPYSEGDAISTDAAGNIYFCGNYTGTADLNPGAAIFNVTSSSGADAFVIKLDNTGAFVWGKSFGGLGTDNCRTVKADATGNVYLAGDFPLTTDFDPGASVFNLIASGTSDGYVLKLDVNGEFVWVKALGGSAADAARDITLDAANVYITGLFQATVDFDPGAGIYNLTSVGSNDIFICKLTEAGNFVWALNYGGFTLDEGISIFSSASGNLYATGYFKEVVDFDPGTGSTFLNSANGDTYIVNLDATVLPLTLLNFTATNTATGNLLKWQTAQEINTKHFEIEWSVDGLQFARVATEPAAGNSYSIIQYHFLHTTPDGGNHFYRLKMVDIDDRFSYSSVIKINSTISDFSMNVFPNPVVDLLQIDIRVQKKETILLQLQTTDGKIIATKKISLNNGTNHFNWSLQNIPAGNYFISSDKNRFKAIPLIKQ